MFFSCSWSQHLRVSFPVHSCVVFHREVFGPSSRSPLWSGWPWNLKVEDDKFVGLDIIKQYYEIILSGSFDYVFTRYVNSPGPRLYSNWRGMEEEKIVRSTWSVVIIPLRLRLDLITNSFKRLINVGIFRSSLWHKIFNKLEDSTLIKKGWGIG